MTACRPCGTFVQGGTRQHATRREATTMAGRGLRATRRVSLWGVAAIGMLVLVACGGSVPITATAFMTVTSGVPRSGANVAPPASPTEPLAVTPATTIAASPASTATVGDVATPTPLVNGLLTPSAPGTVGTTGTTNTTTMNTTSTPANAANIARTATPAPSTAVTGSTGSTSDTRVVSTSGTAVVAATGTIANVSGATTASGTRVTGTPVTAATAMTTTVRHDERGYCADSGNDAATTATTTRPATTPTGTATATPSRYSRTHHLRARHGGAVPQRGHEKERPHGLSHARTPRAVGQRRL